MKLGTAIRSLHDRLIFQRRVRVLAASLAEFLPNDASVLDVGCGSGLLAQLLKGIKSDVSIRGLEVKPRATCLVECMAYDGENIPLPNRSVDICMFVDVLHHTRNVEQLLSEACRVSKKFVLIKDHLSESRFDHATLAFMDWVGNEAHGVRLTYNYQNRANWQSLLGSAGLRTCGWKEDIPLYPPPFSFLFGRGLHFIGLFSMR